MLCALLFWPLLVNCGDHLLPSKRTGWGILVAWYEPLSCWIRSLAAPLHQHLLVCWYTKLHKRVMELSFLSVFQLFWKTAPNSWWNVPATQTSESNVYVYEFQPLSPVIQAPLEMCVPPPSPPPSIPDCTVDGGAWCPLGVCPGRETSSPGEGPFNSPLGLWKWGKSSDWGTQRKYLSLEPWCSFLPSASLTWWACSDGGEERTVSITNQTNKNEKSPSTQHGLLQFNLRKITNCFASFVCWKIYNASGQLRHQ